MAKKKVMMYIEENVWAGIREGAFNLSTVEKRVSVGDYVTKMFRNGKPKKIAENVDEILKEIPDTEVEFVADDITKEISVPNSLDEQIEKTFKATQIVNINPENQTITDDVSTPMVKSEVIEKAREKIENMVNKSGKGFYPPRPKGQDGKK